ncbi:N-acetyl-alpha-D-glucosaminyl L-malate synthase BshA [Staphylococcus saprophyticus]|uniref:Putative glycosyltransferase n=1 Tax=Staphylococcus saprophyticus subsp. saprophyticus (strain ATCC 15305 / DSM 20229 / NCIMB 8711 / NCTC 7292 / S-41) TaxID=342451 RepID=Q49XR4_STAS1|nr:MULTISPECIES: N-acetyl-alpha-D-glucosaminyl L-malate synthase BshA [Staphylococcus]CRV18897.1 glycosyltransferase%2C group 1 family protein [Streptococcus equi subsp. equi]AMG20393.1 N-acetyl-alpha-D-glucosaminyl L-malate synthase BshA [Staphylococcus saprophyticus]AMG33452.1 N-acetyl-alpha-D-glucosaminyl L-malate synthase BshA [Staphylococcus saprophyticus]ASF18133.1 N-acetyl-alpha-D-glucosaminyl L-malate synthase BshA [Staphylococcus saprophyticus]MBC2920847.1 N-acetyl-alpha-D-glucosaminy
MKIGITCYPSMGGSGIIATELGIKLAERGHDIHFITSNIPFRIRKPLPNMTFHQVEVNQYAVFQYPPYDITLSTKIAEVINEYDLDVLHMHYAVPHAVCGILAKHMSQKDIKIMTTLHGTDITVLGYDHSLKNAIKFGIEGSDVVTSVSQSLAQQTYDIIETDKEIVPIYNFVREKEFPTKLNTPTSEDEQLKACYGIQPDEKVLIHVSNFRSVKRIDTIIDTFARVHKAIPSKLILLGDGPELMDMKEKARQLNLEDAVLFLGKQNWVSQFYQISDLVLLLSEKESFGLTLLEAMKSGVVPIGSTAGGIKEVIKHEDTGYIVNVGDDEAASAYAIQLLTNPELYHEMQTRMLEDVANRFSSDLIADQYEYYYKKMLEGNND